MILFVTAWLVLLLTSAIFVAFLRAEAAVKRLDRRSSDHFQSRNWPTVSIVFAARNEEPSIERAVESMLAIDYAHYELIAVDDRSTDRTNEILLALEERFHGYRSPLDSTHKTESEARSGTLKVVRVNELPVGWLGKCHALHIGAKQADGDWLLFTDADIHMRSDVLQIAIAHAIDENADHLTLAPYCELPSWILRTFVATFAFMFKAFVKPHRIADPKSKAHAGVGAFNLIRRDVYRAIGGHETVRLAPDDDVKLGKAIKEAGFRQRFANGLGLLSVPWYQSFGELSRGLEKNCFAGIDYRYSVWFVSNLLIFSIAILPWVLLPFASTTVRIVLAASCILWMTMGAINAVRSGFRIDHGLALPLGLLLFLWVFNRSVVLTLVRGGVTWRDTFYSLKELRSFASERAHANATAFKS